MVSPFCFYLLYPFSLQGSFSWSLVKQWRLLDMSEYHCLLSQSSNNCNFEENQSAQEGRRESRASEHSSLTSFARQGQTDTDTEHRQIHRSFAALKDLKSGLLIQLNFQEGIKKISITPCFSFKIIQSPVIIVIYILFTIVYI